MENTHSLLLRPSRKSAAGFFPRGGRGPVSPLSAWGRVCLGAPPRGRFQRPGRWVASVSPRLPAEEGEGNLRARLFLPSHAPTPALTGLMRWRRRHQNWGASVKRAPSETDTQARRRVRWLGSDHTIFGGQTPAFYSRMFPLESLDPLCLHWVPRRCVNGCLNDQWDLTDRNNWEVPGPEENGPFPPPASCSSLPAPILPSSSL